MFETRSDSHGRRQMERISVVHCVLVWIALDGMLAEFMSFVEYILCVYGQFQGTMSRLI